MAFNRNTSLRPLVKSFSFHGWRRGCRTGSFFGQARFYVRRKHEMRARVHFRSRMTHECLTAHAWMQAAQQCNGQTDAFFALMIQLGNRECRRFNGRSGIRRDFVWQWNSFAT